MKPKWVATLNAGKCTNVFQPVKNLFSVFFLSFVLVIISCDKNDDLETDSSESPIPIDSPLPIDSPPNSETIIIYTDIEPDFKSENISDSYNLDLNNDQIFDFIIRSIKDDNYEYLVIGSSPNATNGIFSVAPWYTQPLPLENGEKIFKIQGYKNGEFYDSWGIFAVGDCFLGEQGCYYDWKDKVDMYLGLKIEIKGQTHYGWARLDITDVTHWVIKDYAYNATANKPILSGQKES